MDDDLVLGDELKPVPGQSRMANGEHSHEGRPLLRKPSEAPSPPTAFVWRCGITAGVSGLCFGVEIGIIDAILAMRSFQLFFGTAAYDADGVLRVVESKDEVEGNIVAAFLAGAMGGSILVSYLADAWGRRGSLRAGSLLFIAGGLIQALAVNLAMLYAGRAVSGAAIGVLSMVAPLYVGEVAPAESRGRLVALVQLLITVGILLASCVNALMYSLFESAGEAQWRGALAAQIVPGVALAALLLFMPESPRWSLSKGRMEEAGRVLARLRGVTSAEAPAVVADMAAMQALVEADAVKVESFGQKSAFMRHSWVEPWAPLLSGPGLRRLLTACALQVFQQATGINVILYYGARLFEELGVPKEHAATSLVSANAALLVLGTLPGLALVDRPTVGRRKLLIWGGIGMAMMHTGIAACVLGMGSGGGPTATASGWAAVVFMLSFTVVFSASWGPVVWVFQSECWASGTERAKGGAAATCANWATNAVIGKAAPLLLTAIGPWTYVIFAALCGGMSAFVWAVVPETGGRSLEQMGEILM
jgi:sugar porter (SP) family MFS transporter